MSIFFVFLWKNFKYIKFHWKWILFILAGCIALLSTVLHMTYAVVENPEHRFEAKSEEILQNYFSGEYQDVICYAPSSDFLDNLMEQVQRELSIMPIRLKGFPNNNELLLYMEQKKQTRSFGILFEKFPSDNSSSEHDLKYSISATHSRVSTDEIFYNNREIVGIQDVDDYISTGFFLLQYTIDRQYIKLRTSEEPYPIEVVPFPRIAMKDIDSFRIMTFGLLFITFLYILILTTLLVPLVEEKQDGIHAYLAFATSHSYLNGITFYIIRFIYYLVFIVTSVVVAYVYEALGKICALFVIILFVLFTLSAMNFAFLVSIFLKSVYFSKIGGFLAFFVPTVLFSIENSIFGKLSFLISGNVFLKGIEIFQIYTNKKRKFLLSDVFNRITEPAYTLGEVYVILILQIIIYITLYNYLANIFPGAGGIRKPFYYIFQIFQRRKPRNDQSSESGLNSDIPIKIRNLVKTFETVKGRTKKAVNNLNMDVENNKITVLLGHNGAGKTTTINMIVGSIEKTSGDIYVFGENNVEMYRNMVGYCPQHNIYMQYLTCEEHLYFFSRLRGLTRLEAITEASTLLDDLLLKDKAKEMGENLSGGMKRRLALGMAIAGKTNVTILDEPTSGLDPESRRTLWDILLKMRKTRSVLITTHYMEEAEVLGDVISIMSHGELVCTGTSLELKRTYGSGYILKLLTNEQFENIKTMQLIHSYIPSARIHSIVEPTVCISLPYENRSNYSNVLSALEESMTYLGISYISITNSSLEEVFLNCGGKDETDASHQPKLKSNIPYIPFKNGLTDPTIKASIIAHQSFAVLYKKAIYIKRKWIYTLVMCLIPLLTIGITFWAMNSDTAFSRSENPLELKVNIPNSDIYIKLAPELQSFADYLDTEINRMNCKPKHVESHDTLENVLLNIQSKNITYFYDRIFGAIELTMNDNNVATIKIFYSGNIIHSSAILLNLIDNVLLKFTSKQDNVSITTINVPTRRSVVVSPARLEYYNTLIPIGWFFYILFYVSLPFRERKSEFNKMQNISRAVYWFSYTLSDIALHFFVCFLAYIAHRIFDTRNIYNLNEIASFSATFCYYGIMYLPLLYLLANTFKSISSLSMCLFLLLIVSTIIPIITSGNQQAMQLYEVVNAVLMILPDFGLKYQLSVINENYFINRRNEFTYKEENTSDDMEFVTYMKTHEKPMSTLSFYFYAAFIFVGLEVFLIFFWDRIYRRESLSRFCSFKKCLKRSDPIYSSYELDQVSTDHCSSKDEIKERQLNVNNLHKRYGYGKIHAVRGIDFNVNSGECFGLLGLNGAGKSSTFEMITGNSTISSGAVSIKGVNIHSNGNLFNFLYGYCPQSNALNGFMTSYEILKYMALLRGIGMSHVHTEVMSWLGQLDLLKYRNIPCRYYSGGTKRKLNTALALIGDPEVIFLDEPTTGVDPKSRRFMWKCIQDFQKNNKTIVLTSHSMDECEHLCNRLAIMVGGKFKCIGYIPKLKEQFGCEFTITVKIKPNFSNDDLIMLKAELDSCFQCDLREQHDCIITYSVKKKPIIWSNVFSSMKSLMDRNSHILIDYSISETTLEDIFLNIEKCMVTTEI